MHIDVIGSGSDEDNRLYLTYYASDEDCERSRRTTATNAWSLEISERGHPSYTASVTFDAFSGYPIVRQGLHDLEAERETIPALLVLVGAPRLRKVGIDVPASKVTEPEHRLYAMLAAEDSDSAHSRYNALIRELVSFERAAECAA